MPRPREDVHLLLQDTDADRALRPIRLDLLIIPEAAPADRDPDHTRLLLAHAPGPVTDPARVTADHSRMIEETANRKCVLCRVISS